MALFLIVVTRDPPSTQSSGSSNNLPASPSRMVTRADPAKAQRFSGNGQKVTSLFRLNAGRVVFRMTHNVSSNFSIWLEDDTADLVELLVNEIGTFDGSRSVHIEYTGWFMLDISANGAWTVTIEQ